MNLVDLEKCKQLSIWLQESASIQKRTSPRKFDNFRSRIPNFTASNLSTKQETSPPAAADALWPRGESAQRRGGLPHRDGRAPARAGGTATPAAPASWRRASAALLTPAERGAFP